MTNRHKRLGSHNFQFSIFNLQFAISLRNANCKMQIANLTPFCTPQVANFQPVQSGTIIATAGAGWVRGCLIAMLASIVFLFLHPGSCTAQEQDSVAYAMACRVEA